MIIVLHPGVVFRTNTVPSHSLGGEGTTIKDAYKPYDAKNYIPTKVAR